MTEQFFSVPLDHSKPDGRHIRLFCRTAEPFENPVILSDDSKPKQRPLIVYINGGPGFGCPPPQEMPCTSVLLEKGYKLVCFDHRGMGLSNTITASTLKREGSDEAQAEYLTHFRAPNAVCDLEAIRMCFTKDYPEGQRTWSVLGQSYGGFVITSYLSMYPEGLREALIFGGLPPVLEKSPDATVKRAVMKVRARNEKYYEKHPQDVDNVRRIVKYLRKMKVVQPDGGVLTPGKFLEQGIGFGMHGGLDSVHANVLRAVNDLDLNDELTRPTIDGIPGTGFDSAILYAVLHEAIYCQGASSNWAFDRIIATQTNFGVTDDKQQYLFTGEMVFSSVYETYSELQGLKGVADALHAKSDWTDLYDIDQLKKNTVPVYAAVYSEDMYVALETSLNTASIIKGCQTYVTNQLYHNAIRSKTQDVLKAVFALREDTID